MRIRIYVWIDGDNFDAKQFNDSLNAESRGEIKQRKRVESGHVVAAGTYWMSRVSEAEGNLLDVAVCKLVKSIKENLLPLSKKSGVRIVLEVAAEYDDAEPLRGYFLSRESIELLSEIGAGLDIDVVRSLQ